MSVPFLSYAFLKYYIQLNLRIQAKSGFERTWKILSKLRPSSNTLSPNSVKQIQIQGIKVSMQLKGLGF
jgi:hypothetical protein